MSSGGGLAGGSGIGQGGWLCNACTFMNSTDGFACQICGTTDPQRQQEFQQSQTQYGWLCLSCTYLNPYILDTDDSQDTTYDQPTGMPSFRGGVGDLANSGYGGIGGGFSVAVQAFNGGLGDLNQGVSPRTQAQHYTCGMCGTVDRQQRVNYDKKAAEKEKRRWERIQLMRQQKQQEEQRLKELQAEKQKRDEEEQRRKDQQLKERMKVFLPLYEEVYFTCLKLSKRSVAPQSTERVFEMARLIFKHSDLDDLVDKKQVDEDDDLVMYDCDPTQCQVCYSDFDGMQTKSVRATNCKHAMICTSCFHQYIAVRIRDKEIMPWIPCPHSECTSPLHPDDVLKSGIDIGAIFQLFQNHLQKHIARDKNWIECVADGCEFGFYVEGDTNTKKQKCRACGKRQVVERSSDKADAAFQKMIKEGTVRDCPQCGNHQMKDYGICNVIQCPKCNIWWNWKTRETGRTERELKQRSRMAGTLWEAGELNFQRRLQQTDLPAFIKLLENNGIPYDPSYIRGT